MLSDSEKKTLREVSEHLSVDFDVDSASENWEEAVDELFDKVLEGERGKFRKGCLDAFWGVILIMCFIYTVVDCLTNIYRYYFP